MNSVILRTATRFTIPLLLLFAIVILLQGHNKPGGGFIGGLIAAAAFSLHALAFNAAETRKVLVVDLRTLIGVGLLIALSSAFIPLFVNLPFMTGVWVEVPVGGGAPIKLGTPLLFDLGVFTVVISVTLLMVLTLLDPQERPD